MKDRCVSTERKNARGINEVLFREMIDRKFEMLRGRAKEEIHYWKGESSGLMRLRD